MSNSPKCLDIGCGPNKTAGFIGLDIYAFEGVDIVRDIMRGIPFNDNTFEGVLCKHVAEHFEGEDFIFLVEEVWRVLVGGGTFNVVVPSASSPNRYRDPTHKIRDFHSDSFMFWEVDENNEYIIFRGNHYNTRAKFELIDTNLDYNKDRHYLLKAIK